MSKLKKSVLIQQAQNNPVLNSTEASTVQMYAIGDVSLVGQLFTMHLALSSFYAYISLKIANTVDDR